MLGLSTLLISDVLAQEKIAITANIDPITILTNELIPLLDTSSIGNLTSVSITANLPCDTSNVPKLKIIAGILGNTTNVIDSSSDYTNNKGPRDTCLFTDSVTNVTEAGIPAINRVFVKNIGSTPVHIPQGVMVTLSGIFGQPLVVPPQTTPPTFSDDFTSSSEWTQSGTPISVNTANTRIDYDGQINGVAGGRLYHDMGVGNISDSEWVLRFPWNVVTATANSGNNQPYGFFGITDNIPTGINQPNDGIGIFWSSESPGLTWHASAYDDTTRTDSTWSHQMQVEQLYIEMIRISTTSMKITLYSDSAYSNVVETKTVTIPNTVTGLRYIWFAEFDTTGYVSGGGRYVTQVNGDLQFWNGVTSPP